MTGDLALNPDCNQDPSGFHPVWEEEVSFTILNPHCAFLHILMLDDEFIGDDYIGQVQSL